MRKRGVFLLLVSFMSGVIAGASGYWLIRRNEDLKVLGNFVDLDDEFEALFEDDSSSFQ